MARDLADVPLPPSEKGVTKGRATAPPAFSARMGVWNSRKPLSWRKSRMYLMMWERSRRVSTDLRLVSKSMWRL